MATLYDFYIEKAKKIKKDEDVAYLKHYPIYNVDGKRYIGNYSSFLACTETDKQILEFINKIFKYHEEKRKFNNITILGERKFEDFKIKIKKNISNCATFSLFYKDLHIGERQVEFNSFETYVKLGIFTISGTSNIFYPNFVGKGLGKFLYETIDKTFSYQQIPQGHAGARGSLNYNSTKFWNIRKKNQVVPEFNSNNKKNKELEKAFDISSSDLSLLLFSLYPEIQYSDYIQKKDTHKIYHKKFFPEYINDKKFEEFDLKKERKIFINKIISSFSNDNSSFLFNHSAYFFYKDYNTFRNEIMKHECIEQFLSSDRWNKDFLENGIKEIYNQKYPYYPYPEDITLINTCFDTLESNTRLFYKKNGDNYDIGVIKILNYPSEEKLTYSRILKKVSQKELKESIENIIQQSKKGIDFNYMSIHKEDIKHLSKEEIQKDLLSKYFFSQDEHFFYFGNFDFSKQINKKEMIKQLSLYGVKPPEEPLCNSSSYGKYQSNISEEEKINMLNVDKQKLSMK